MIWWIAALCATVGQFAWLIWMKRTPSLRIGWRFNLCFSGICGCLAIITALLCTTPVDAIRLPRWISELLIIGGIALLALPGFEQLPIAMGRVVFTLPALVLLRIRRKSPWWVAPIAWFPVTSG